MQDNNQRFVEAYNLAIKFTKTENVIGIQKEKILHKTIKYYLCKDDCKHEIKINKGSKEFLYADVFDKDMIYEVQTANFDKLRNKLDCVLKNNKVTIVHPIAHKKKIYKINEYGEILKPRYSPKIGSVFDVFKELYKIKNYLNHSNLYIKILLIDLDEYRQIIIKKHFKSCGYKREIQIPNVLYQEIDLNKKEDYKRLLSNMNLEKGFTSFDLSKSCKISKSKATITLHILWYLGVIKRIGKNGNRFIYEIL